MENLIVELVVREPDGTTRAGAPGETGEVVITDLHNLALPIIRYVNGDLAVARATERVRVRPLAAADRADRGPRRPRRCATAPATRSAGSCSPCCSST